MWRRIRIGVLLFILASVAQSAWVARTRTAEWKTSLRVVIYPISADASATSTQYVSELRKTTFDPIEAFFRTEGKKYSASLGDPVDVFLAPAIPSRPPAPPFGGSTLRIILWSLELRFWAWRNDTHNGPKPDVRLFVSYHDPALTPRLPHSTGLQKGLMGVVNAFAESRDGRVEQCRHHARVAAYPWRNRQVRPGREPAALSRRFADPDARPLYPQQRAEIMAGRIPISETRAEIAEGMKQVVIGAKTAREISWTK